jgi:poly(A) polymerase
VTEALATQPWMTATATRRVMAALEAAGGTDCARFVGGCVRNAIIGRPVDDIDIATTLEPKAVMQALRAGGLNGHPTGIEHGTITAVSNGRPFEITTLRRDVETDGRRAVVAFTTDWNEDAARRDFRLNALYAGADGTLYDPTGGGLEDARAGRIVFVGEPAMRIREDALRILRFFRFLAWYGRGEPDPEGLAACAALRDLTLSLSAERVSAELQKLFAAEDPRPAVRLMADAGVLALILPEAANPGRFWRIVDAEAAAFLEPDPLLRLAALLPDDPVVGEAVAQRLRLSNAQRDRLKEALKPEPRLVCKASPKETRALVYRMGLGAFKDRVLLSWAGSDQATAVQWLALLALANNWERPLFPLTGTEVMAAGAPKGPLVGKVLQDVEAWWIENDFPDDEQALTARVKAVVQGLAS